MSDPLPGLDEAERFCRDLVRDAVDDYRSMLNHPLTAAVQRMLHSMIEEETGVQSGTASHADLVADFVAALGQPKQVTTERARRLKPHFQAWADLSEFLGRCRPYWQYRGTVSLAGEAQFTQLCKIMVEALPKHYGITGEGLAFWEVHIPIDAEHTSSAVALVAPFMDEPENRRILKQNVFLHMDYRYRAWLEPLGEVRSGLETVN